MLDFTLRSAVLQHPTHREAGIHDVVFRDGRMCAVRPAPPGCEPRLYLTTGFHDAHIHLLHQAMGARRLDLSAATSLADALQAIADFSRSRPTGVIWGVGWDETNWPEQRLPSRADIDQHVAERPVIMRRVCGHVAILNSAALEEARRRWPDLDASGRVAESQSMELASLWPDDPAEREAALRETQERALRMGITRIGEMGSNGALDTYLAMQRAGNLKLHVDIFVPPSGIEAALAMRESGGFNGRLSLGGVKIFADGSIGARTAALLESYADRQSRGALLLADHALHDILARCRQDNLRVAIHAIGDAALGQALRQIERVVEEMGPLAPYGVSLEHAELPSPELLDRIARLGVRLSMQPNFVARWGAPGQLYERALGRERWSAMNPFREVWSREITLAFGSDGMPMDPALGLRGATQHPIERARLSDTEALAVYLGGRSGATGFWDTRRAWVEGCDRAVLYQSDPLALCAGELAAAPVAGVLLDGEWAVPPAEELARTGILHVD